MEGDKAEEEINTPITSKKRPRPESKFHKCEVYRTQSPKYYKISIEILLINHHNICDGSVLLLIWITRNYLVFWDHEMKKTSQLPQIICCVQQGVRWLKENAETLTDARDIAITISTLIAAEKNRHSQLVQRLVSALVQKQAVHGSWNDELWDTVWAAKAIHDAGYEMEALPLQNAFRFLEATQDPFTGTWYEEPFETMLVLDLVARIAPERMAALSSRACKWVASLQKLDGCVIGIRYTGMAASLFCLAERFELNQGSRVKEAAVQYIRRDLEDKPIWTAAAWSNYYPLKALIDCGASLDDPTVEKAVGWFLGSQGTDGKWMQVSRVHDTSMAVLVLSELLTTPLVDVSDPRIGVLNAFKENGTIRVGFHGPGAGAITLAERMKISDQVRADLSHNQHLIVTAMRKARGKQNIAARKSRRPNSIKLELEKAGKYAYGHLIPAQIQSLLAKSSADHLRLDIDERLIDLPWELVHDGNEFLCLRYAVGRRLVSNQDFLPPQRHPQAAQDSRVLIVADPTGDLPAAKREGRKLANLLRDKCHMQVDEFTA
jgi:hypothetical protein